MRKPPLVNNPSCTPSVRAYFVPTAPTPRKGAPAVCPIPRDRFARRVFSGNPPHAPYVYGWIVRLGGRSTPAEHAWLKLHGYTFCGGKWARSDRVPDRGDS